MHKKFHDFLLSCLAEAMLLDDVEFSETLLGDGQVGYVAPKQFSQDHAILQPISAAKGKIVRGASNPIYGGGLENTNGKQTKHTWKTSSSALLPEHRPHPLEHELARPRKLDPIQSKSTSRQSSFCEQENSSNNNLATASPVPTEVCSANSSFHMHFKEFSMI